MLDGILQACVEGGRIIKKFKGFFLAPAAVLSQNSYYENAGIREIKDDLILYEYDKALCTVMCITNRSVPFFIFSSKSSFDVHMLTYPDYASFRKSHKHNFSQAEFVGGIAPHFEHNFP